MFCCGGDLFRMIFGKVKMNSLIKNYEVLVLFLVQSVAAREDNDLFIKKLF